VKVALVILGLLAITFGVVIVWGVSRGGDAGTGGWFGKPPPASAGGKPDEDSLADWDIPPIGEMLAPALAPFATPVKVSRPAAEIPAHGETQLTVGESDEDFQTARLTLNSGAAARVRADPDDDTPEDATACLCQDGGLVDAGFFDQCGKRWKADRRTSDGRILCRAGDEKNTLVFGPRGGTLTVAADASAARVSVR
jgi:hypothetical protein